MSLAPVQYWLVRHATLAGLQLSVQLKPGAARLCLLALLSFFQTHISRLVTGDRKPNRCRRLDKDCTFLIASCYLSTWHVPEFKCLLFRGVQLLVCVSLHAWYMCGSFVRASRTRWKGFFGFTVSLFVCRYMRPTRAFRLGRACRRNLSLPDSSKSAACPDVNLLPQGLLVAQGLHLKAVCLIYLSSHTHQQPRQKGNIWRGGWCAKLPFIFIDERVDTSPLQRAVRRTTCGRVRTRRVYSRINQSRPFDKHRLVTRACEGMCGRGMVYSNMLSRRCVFV